MFQQLLAVLGLFLSFLLIYFNLRKRPATIYLGLFFALLSAYAFFQYVIAYSHQTELVALVFIHTAFTGLLISPMLFFYVRSVITGSSKLRMTDLLHFVPAFLYIIASFPYFILPWEVKMEAAMQIITDRNLFWKIGNSHLRWIFPNVLNYSARPLHLTIYASYLFLWLRRYNQNLRLKTKQTTISFSVRWLNTLLIFAFMLSMFQVIMVVYSMWVMSAKLFFSFNFFQTASAIASIVIILIPFFVPSVLYGIPPANNTRTLNEQDAEKEPEKNDKTERTTIEDDVRKLPEFDSTYLEYIGKSVEEAMETNKCYLQKDCNLQLFSKSIQLPPHHIAYYFREVRGQSFNDFRNEWRVKHAKNLMADGNSKLYTMEAIGLLSGFTSRNTFFSAFKKFEGVTPGSFSQQNPAKPDENTE